MMIFFAVLLTSEGLVESEEAEGRICKLLQHDLLLGLFMHFGDWVLNFKSIVVMLHIFYDAID